MEIAFIVIVAGCLALAGWSVWLLHSHWPKSDAAAVRELLTMNIRSYRMGRDQVPLKDALFQMEAEAAQMKDRIDNSRNQDAFISQQRAERAAAGHDPPPDDTETVAVFGNNLEP